MLAVIDGNAGLRRAVGEIWPRAALQRCCVHKLRNLERRAPKHVLAEIRDDFHRIVYAANAEAARAAVLLFSLVASGQIRLRRIDGWRKIATVLRQYAPVAA